MLLLAFVLLALLHGRLRRIRRRRLTLHRRRLLRDHDRGSGEQRQCEECATHHVLEPPEGARTTLARFTVETHAPPRASRVIRLPSPATTLTPVTSILKIGRAHV